MTCNERLNQKGCCIRRINRTKLFLGGTVATNASGARTFKYGPTRNYVERLKIALAIGEVIDICRGELHADANDTIAIPLPSGG